VAKTPGRGGVARRQLATIDLRSGTPDLNDIGDTRFALLTSLPICSLLPRKEFLRGTRISSIATRAKTTEGETIRLQPATEDTYQHVAM
jgi:hypothetical protein